MRAKVDDLHVGQKWSKSISSWENRSWIGMDRMLVGIAWYWSVSAIQWKITISFWRNTRKWGHFPAQIARSGEILTYYWPLVMFSSSPLFQRLCLCRGAPLAPLMLPSEQIGAGQLGPIASREWRKVPCSYWIHIRGYPKMDGADLLSPLSFLCRFKMSPKKNLGMQPSATPDSSDSWHFRDSPSTTTRIPMPSGMARHFSMTQQRQILYWLELVGGFRWDDQSTGALEFWQRGVLLSEAVSGNEYGTSMAQKPFLNPPQKIWRIIMLEVSENGGYL